MLQCLTLKKRRYQRYELSLPGRGELRTLLAKRLTALCSEENLLRALWRCWPDLNEGIQHRINPQPMYPV